MASTLVAMANTLKHSFCQDSRKAAWILAVPGGRSVYGPKLITCEDYLGYRFGIGFQVAARPVEETLAATSL